jgi:hypothetical protein
VVGPDAARDADLALESDPLRRRGGFSRGRNVLHLLSERGWSAPVRSRKDLDLLRAQQPPSFFLFSLIIVLLSRLLPRSILVIICLSFVLIGRRCKGIHSTSPCCHIGVGW